MTKANEFRQDLAQQFLKVLEEDGLKFIDQWAAISTKPMNAISNKNYKGINMFILSLNALTNGYQDPRWATFNQIKENGWTLENARGKGVKVEYWFPYDLKNKKSISWSQYQEIYDSLDDKSEMEKQYSIRGKYYTVFNADLIQGIPKMEIPEKRDIEADHIIEKLSEAMGVPILNDGGDRSYYRPNEDAIHLPLKEFFLSDYDYNSVALHEFGHASGAKNRLNRDQSGSYGTQEYAYEELVAEMTSCFMSTNLTIEQEQHHIDNHKAYVQSWISIIKEKPETLVKAIADAEKATAYLEEKAGLISLLEYQKIEQSTLELKQEELEPQLKEEVSMKLPQDALYRLPAPNLRERQNAPILIYVNWTMNDMDKGKWLELPMDPKQLIKELWTVSYGNMEDILILDCITRSDCGYFEKAIDCCDDVMDVNTVARLIGYEKHPAVEVYCASNQIDRLEPLANVLMQEEYISYYQYQFEGSEDARLMERLSLEEKYGYSFIESDPSLMKYLEDYKIGTSSLLEYVNVAEIGKKAMLERNIELHANGYLLLKPEYEISLDMYRVSDITEVLNEEQTMSKTQQYHHRIDALEQNQPVL